MRSSVGQGVRSRSSTYRRLRTPSASLTSLIPRASSCPTAVSHPLRLNTNVIAGNSPSRSRVAMTSARVGPPPGRMPPSRPRAGASDSQDPRPPRGPRPPPGGPPPGPVRPRSPRWAAESAASARSTERIRSNNSGLTWTRRPTCGRPEESKDSSTNRSKSCLPTMTCCHSGTGRISETTTATSPRTSPSHSPNSSALDTVADSETTRTSSGRWMITSSQTAPRKRSAR
jgi:hypothetical protein